MSKVQMAYARNYAEGDVIRISTADKRQSIPAGTHLSVESVNRAANTLTLRGLGAQPIEVSPVRWKGIQAYQWQDRTIAVGDRIQFRIPDKTRNIANGEFATITKLDQATAKLSFDNQREMELPLAKLRHIDLGYASTSHPAQGATVDRVIVNADSMRSVKLVNRDQFYVSISRARHDAQVFTNDLQTLERAVGRSSKKAVAMEVVKPANPTTELKPAQVLNTTELKPQQTKSFGYRP